MIWNGLKKTLDFAINCEVGQWLRTHIFTRSPNLPKLIGDGIGLLGLLFLLLALKSVWYGVPHEFIETDQGEYKTSLLKSPWEKPGKILAIALLLIFTFLFWKVRNQVFTRTKILGNFATLLLVLGFAFSQLTVVDSKLGHLAAIHVAHHDNLVWYGGDITTSRGQEPYGYASDYIAKDLPLIISPIPLPYSAQNLSSFQDYIKWTGMCPAFWYYFRKGWGYLVLAGTFLLISALCVRLKGEEKGLASEVVGWVIKRLGIVLLLWFLIIFIRSQFCAHQLNTARTAYEDHDFEKSRSALILAGRIMPTVKWDSSLVLQKGALEQELGLPTPAATLHQGFMYELEGRNQAALNALKQAAMQTDDQPVRLEAHRAILRTAINDFNSGANRRCDQSLLFIENQYPTLMKPIFLRFIQAVKNRDYQAAREWQRKLYAASSAQQMPDKRAYLASTHQYLAMMAFDQGEIDTAWQQNIYRMGLNKQGAHKDATTD